MSTRPTRAVIALEIAALAGAVAVAAWQEPASSWDLPLFLSLLALSVTSDLSAVDSVASHVKFSGSFLAIILAAVFLGAVPAALLAVLTIVLVWLKDRYGGLDLLFNVAVYAWFPLVTGIAFHEAAGATGLTPSDPGFYLLVIGLFATALAINFATVTAYTCYLEHSRFWSRLRRVGMPVLPSEVASGLLSAVIAYAYVEIGLPAIAMFALVLLTFQYLMGALVLSQERGDELELRAKQLAGFQVALLSALLRTLDLRDRMTARHSAAVARYAREVAAAAGMPSEQQELAHTAGLLHDIGKFVLPDRILKGDEKLTEADWEQIRKHPYEGARIVAQIDGYQPVGEIILAHHERIDGLGYPRGLSGGEIPEIARIISVADTYDVMTSRDSYREPVTPFEAIAELRRVAGTQLDGRFVELFVAVLADRSLSYQHGEDADFEAELALERRIHDYVHAKSSAGTKRARPPLLFGRG